MFGRQRPLRVEVGFGKSEFLIELAREQPDFDYIGFEYSAKRVRKFLTKLERTGLRNVRAVCCNISDVIDHIFEPGSIDRFFVLFPDPWPKRRHERNRFVQADSMRRVHRLLRTDGGVTLRTDARAYAEQMLEVMEADPGFVNLHPETGFAPRPRERFRTLYEQRYIDEGREIYYLEYDRAELARKRAEGAEALDKLDKPPS